MIDPELQNRVVAVDNDVMKVAQAARAQRR